MVTARSTKIFRQIVAAPATESGIGNGNGTAQNHKGGSKVTKNMGSKNKLFRSYVSCVTVSDLQCRVSTARGEL